MNDDPYQYWRDSLVAGADRPGPAIHVDSPQAGRYWMRKYKGGPRLPVAIFRDPDGALVSIVGFRGQQDKVDAPGTVAMWSWCAEHAITDEEYRTVFAEGRFSSDLPADALPPKQPVAPAIVSAVVMPKPEYVDERSDNPRAVLGGNNPPDTEFESLKEQLAAVKKNVETLPKVLASDDDAKLVQGYRARLLELGNQFDKRREALKRPHLEAGRVVDNLWNPFVHDAEGTATDLRKKLAAWETKKDKKVVEHIDGDPKNNDLDNLRVVTQPPITPAATKITGGYGRSASVQSIRVITKVTDYAAIFTYFANRQDLQEFLFDLARKAVKAGEDVPGCEIDVQKDVK